MEQIKIEFQATNKVIKAAHKADKARAASRNEILRAFACGNVGNLQGYEADKSQLLALAITEADKRQAAEVVVKFAETATTAAEVKAALAKADKATEAINKAAKAEATAETAAKEATKAHNEAKRQAKATAEAAEMLVRMAKRGQASAAEVKAAEAKAEAAHKAMQAAAKVEAEAAEKLGKARNATKAAAEATEAAKAKVSKATEAAAFAAAKVQRITADNCQDSPYFRRFLLNMFNANIPTIDGRYFKWLDITAKAIDEAEVLTCNEAARLKCGAKEIKAEAFPLWDNGRKFAAADVTTTSAEGKVQFLRLYFRDETSGELYQVTGHKDTDGEIKVVISTAVYTSTFAPSSLLDCLKYALAPSTAAKAKADKAEAKAAKEEADKAAETSGNKAKADKCERLQELRDEADKLQDMDK